jgi:hypothetical protein
MEFATEFLQFSSLGTSIYRPHIQMSVWLDKPRRRSDGQLCDRLSTISLKFFPDLSRFRTVLPCCLDSRTSAARNFHIKALRIRTKGMVLRTVDLMHTISI